MKFGQVTYFGEKQKYLVSILCSGHHCCHGNEGPFLASFQQFWFKKISQFSDFEGIDPLNNRSKWREKCILNFHFIMAYSCCKNNYVKSFCLHKICSSMGKGSQILYFVRKIQKMYIFKVNSGVFP